MIVPRRSDDVERDREGTTKLKYDASLFGRIMEVFLLIIRWDGGEDVCLV
jgi:hypothetical protein